MKSSGHSLYPFKCLYLQQIEDKKNDPICLKCGNGQSDYSRSQCRDLVPSRKMHHKQMHLLPLIRELITPPVLQRASWKLTTDLACHLELFYIWNSHQLNGNLQSLLSLCWYSVLMVADMQRLGMKKWNWNIPANDYRVSIIKSIIHYKIFRMQSIYTFKKKSHYDFDLLLVLFG